MSRMTWSSSGAQAIILACFPPGILQRRRQCDFPFPPVASNVQPASATSGKNSTKTSPSHSIQNCAPGTAPHTGSTQLPKEAVCCVCVCKEAQPATAP